MAFEKEQGGQQMMLPGQLGWLASLRGLAALLVFLSHLFIVPVSRGFLFMLGRIGVVCFFFITGYLAISARQKRNQRQYFFNRFLRLYPVYWILLLITFAIHSGAFSYAQLVANFTLFQEFMGFRNMIGASWMLPIQIIFLSVVLLFGTKFFISGHSEKEVLQRGLYLTIGCSLLALVTAALRHYTGKPFPTALFLLNGISVIGVYYWYTQGGLKKLKKLFFMYEAGLFIAVPLSYPDKIFEYIVAYNIGIALFVAFEKTVTGQTRFDSWMTGLGKIGFTFFLGAGIPYSLYLHYFPSLNTGKEIFAACSIKFIGAVLLGGALTNGVEIPLQKWEKKVEKLLA